MQNDIARQLIDPETGKLKPFDRWVRDIQGMTDHYVHSWLKTEYDTAVNRAHQAADWKHFVEEQDVFPNVRWMPTTSVTPDPLHERYWQLKLTLPVSHPFWNEHHPGDRWNCKCTLEQTDEPVNDSALDGWTPPLPMPGLDNNPAKDGKIFSDTHPYITEGYAGSREAVENFVKSLFKPMPKEESKGDQVESTENLREMASALRLPVPKRMMTFEQACGYLASNPKVRRGRRYLENCQCCVISHELRIRGFDVEARPFSKWSSKMMSIYKQTELAWLDKKTKQAPVVMKTSRDKSKMQSDFAFKTTDTGRYHVRYINYKGHGHIVTFERRQDGTGVFYDPQNGAHWSESEWFRRKVSVVGDNKCIDFYRVDNLDIDVDICKAAVKKKRR